MDDIFLNRS